MSCNCQKTTYKAVVNIQQAACLPCALAHLDLAEETVAQNRRHLAVWHFARAAELAPKVAKILRAARINYQKYGRAIDWNHLHGLI